MARDLPGDGVEGGRRARDPARSAPASAGGTASATAPSPLPDVVAPGLRLLLCGINPSLRSAEVGHHFARPGNRFWPALHLAGLTPRRLLPAEQDELVALGLGLTNLAPRATRRADELTAGELLAGALALEAKVAAWRPAVVGIVGVTAYRTAFGRPRAVLGAQDARLAGAALWVLPNPSGLNAHHRLADLAAWYRRAWDAAGAG